MSKKSEFKINDVISITWEGKVITGNLVGIDTYSLEGFDGKTTGWPSYTLVSTQKRPFDRYWFVRWGEANWILWLGAKSPIVPSNAKFIPSKSGIAQIKFEGNAGVSTPFAALVQYQTNSGYFSAERFAGSEALCFSGYKIAKPKIILGN